VPDERRTETLENDPGNPCVGCGPRNPRGLRLEFRRHRDEIVSELLADASLEGWPGRLHSGILYLAMLDVANCTVYGLRNRVGLPVRTSALSLHRWVPTGARLRLAGVPAPSGGEADLTIHVEAQDGAGRVANLDRDYALASRAKFVRRLGYDELPEGLREVVPE
jgi:hypothetical protein